MTCNTTHRVSSILAGAGEEEGNVPYVSSWRYASGKRTTLIGAEDKWRPLAAEESGPMRRLAEPEMVPGLFEGFVK